jgi:hypothetical protein
MPTFIELQNRVKRKKSKPIHFGSEEILIADARAAMRPGDFIEAKLRAAQRVDSLKTDAIRSTRRT